MAIFQSTSVMLRHIRFSVRSSRVHVFRHSTRSIAKGEQNGKGSILTHGGLRKLVCQYCVARLEAATSSIGLGTPHTACI